MTQQYDREFQKKTIPHKKFPLDPTQKTVLKPLELISVIFFGGGIRTPRSPRYDARS